MSGEDTPIRDWLVLADSGWTPVGDGTRPPVDRIVGAWPVADQGTVGRFEPNALHVPTAHTDPTSIVGAAARLAVAGRADAADLVLLAVRDSVLHLAVDPQGRVVVDAAPDGQPCVVVVTSEVDRLRIGPCDWLTVDLPMLLAVMPDGVDVLVDPGGPAAMRLLAEALHELAESSEETG